MVIPFSKLRRTASIAYFGRPGGRLSAFGSVLRDPVRLFFGPRAGEVIVAAAWKILTGQCPRCRRTHRHAVYVRSCAKYDARLTTHAILCYVCLLAYAGSVPVAQRREQYRGYWTAAGGTLQDLPPELVG